MLLSIVILSLLAFIISFVLTRFTIKLAFKFNLIDDKNHRKHPAQIHKGSIPRAGGLSLYLGILIPILLFLPINKLLIGILIACAVTTIIGILDDRKDINPYLRFIGNILTATIVVGAGVGIPFINNPFNGVIHFDAVKISFDFFGQHSILILADIIAILFIVWTMNIVGWSAGIDGQLPGFVAIASGVLGILSLRFTAHDISQWIVTSIAFITMGSFLGFLPWNFYPQKIMPGYGGKSLAGLMLAVLSILSGAKVGTMILVLALPITDAIFIVFRRIYSRKSPVWADSKHFHHYLLAIGWGKRRIALFYWVVTASLGIVGLNISSGGKLFVFLTVFAVVGAVLFWMNNARKEFTQTSPRTFPKSNPRNHQS